MRSDRLSFCRADPSDPSIREMLSRHSRHALANAQGRQGHALEPESLNRADIELWSLVDAGGVLAVGALRRIEPRHGELKSMFVDEGARGAGLGRRLLEGLIERARQQGFERLSLETGAGAYFDAARRLYAAAGFESCPAFADLPPHPDSVFMTRSLLRG